KPYRNQKTLDIVFAVSCVLMLLCTFWMVAADFYREWKPAQRLFRDVKTAINQRLALENLPNPKSVRDKSLDLAERRLALEAAKKEIRKIQDQREAILAKATGAYQIVKADAASAESAYDIAVEHV